MSDEAPNRITVSRDALRADLAEMELRLRVYFDDQLRHKADLATVVLHAQALDALGRGEFTDAQTRSITEIAEHVLEENTGRTWTKRERWIGVVALVLTVLSLALSAYFGSKAAQTTPITTPPEAVT